MSLLVLCACPNRETAIRLARQAVERQLAACANLLPGLTSIYRWKGHVESADEVLLLLKTSDERYDELETAIAELHPYELPEIIAVRIEDGLSAYLDWVAQCTKNTS